MDFKKIEREMSRFKAIVEGWSKLPEDGIAPMERDLALDHLKTIYELVRFADDEASEDDSSSVAPAVTETAECEAEEEPSERVRPVVSAASIVAPELGAGASDPLAEGINLDDLMTLDMDEEVSQSEETSAEEPAEEPVTEESEAEPVEEETVAEEEPVEATEEVVAEESAEPIEEAVAEEPSTEPEEEPESEEELSIEIASVDEASEEQPVEESEPQTEEIPEPVEETKDEEEPVEEPIAESENTEESSEEDEEVSFQEVSLEEATVEEQTPTDEPAAESEEEVAPETEHIEPATEEKSAEEEEEEVEVVDVPATEEVAGTPEPETSEEEVPAEETPAPAEEEKVVTEPETKPEPESEPEEEIEPEPEKAPEVTPEPVQAAETAAEASAEPAAEPEQETSEEDTTEEDEEFIPLQVNLFGQKESADERTRRHRHKQRVIMSLYGEEEPRHDEPAKQEDDFVLETIPVKDEEAHDETLEPKPATKEPLPKKEDFEFVDLDLDAVEEDEDEVQIVVPQRDSIGESLAEASEKPVLGEVIRPHTETLGDSFAPQQGLGDMLRREEKGVGLEDGIGVNDKFLLIRDLFNNDVGAYNQVMHILNQFEALDDCLIYIAENYTWNPNSEGAKLLMDLLERKFDK